MATCATLSGFDSEAPPHILSAAGLPSSLLSLHAATIVELEADQRDSIEISLSDSPAPRQQVCQSFGRWIPDSTILLFGMTANTAGTAWTSVLIGSFNPRTQPGWSATANADGSWTLTAGVACSPEAATF
jgi:hypothetical protein